MDHNDTTIKMWKLILTLLFISNSALASPSHFTTVIGSALLCKDQVSATYFNDYMSTYFGKPAFTSGGANWWKLSDNDKLFNSPVEYIFVGLELDFIGATFKDTPDKLIANVKDALGIDFKQVTVEKWVAPTYGVIIKYYDKNTPTKMFCIGTPYSPDLS